MTGHLPEATLQRTHFSPFRCVCILCLQGGDRHRKCLHPHPVLSSELLGSLRSQGRDTPSQQACARLRPEAETGGRRAADKRDPSAGPWKTTELASREGTGGVKEKASPGKGATCQLRTWESKHEHLDSACKAPCQAVSFRWPNSYVHTYAQGHTVLSAPSSARVVNDT